MTALDWYGIAALAAIGAAFVLVREVPKYLVAAAAVVVGFASATLLAGAAVARPVDWVTYTLGLAACAFGLLIVRLMLVRSVSLRLLSRLERPASDPFLEDIGGRLEDMARFRLIQLSGDVVCLTPFGRTIARLMAICYVAFRIEP